MSRAPLRDFAVGLFVLMGLAAIAYLSLNVGGLSLRTKRGMQLYADFDEIGGLKARAPVVIAGVKVGQVTGISLDENFRARVKLEVKPDLKLPRDSSASIITAGLLGDQFISVQVGGDDEHPLQPGETITITESALSLERLIGKFIYSSDTKNGSDKKENGSTEPKGEHDPGK